MALRNPFLKNIPSPTILIFKYLYMLIFFSSSPTVKSLSALPLEDFIA